MKRSPAKFCEDLAPENPSARSVKQRPHHAKDLTFGGDRRRHHEAGDLPVVRGFLVRNRTAGVDK